MCGIAGIINIEGVQPSDLNTMSKSIRHRGPDDEGFALFNPNSNCILLKGDDTIAEFNELNPISLQQKDSNNTIGFVHRRLSILDLSAAGHQPMQYMQNKYSIIFNGEIYNYQEIKSTLKQKGYQFYSDTDTEVILAAYKEYGASCVNHFMGMWAFAIYDRDKQFVFISRDRFGIKPLYYYHE